MHVPTRNKGWGGFLSGPVVATVALGSTPPDSLSPVASAEAAARNEGMSCRVIHVMLTQNFVIKAGRDSDSCCHISAPFESCSG